MHRVLDFEFWAQVPGILVAGRVWSTEFRVEEGLK